MIDSNAKLRSIQMPFCTLDGKDDHTLTLEEATDEMQPLDDMLIFGEPVTRIYPAGDMEEVDA
ncbi:hypothetical protein WHU36_24385 [Escherichia coli]